MQAVGRRQDQRQAEAGEQNGVHDGIPIAAPDGNLLQGDGIAFERNAPGNQHHLTGVHQGRVAEGGDDEKPQREHDHEQDECHKCVQCDVKPIEFLLHGIPSFTKDCGR